MTSINRKRPSRQPQFFSPELGSNDQFCYSFGSCHMSNNKLSIWVFIIDDISKQFLRYNRVIDGEIKDRLVYQYTNLSSYLLIKDFH